MYDDNSPDQPERNHTIIRPMPGGRKRPAPPNPDQGDSANNAQQYPTGQSPTHPEKIPPYQSGDHTGSNPVPPQRPITAQKTAPVISLGMNPLVDAAGTILSLASQLQNTASHPDIRTLHRQASELIREFESNLRDHAIDPDTSFSAKYAMCAILDEIILNTPWGSHSFWSTESLLTTFHRETWGGEHVYQIIDTALQQPQQNHDLLELIYLCLSLGFMGKLRVTDRGTIQHDEIRDKIFRSLRPHMGDFDKELSPNCLSKEKKFNKLSGLIPAWVIISVLCLILFGVFAGFSWKLTQDSDPVFKDIHALVPWKPIVDKVTQPQSPEIKSDGKTLRQLLQQEIIAGKLEIDEIPGQITILLYNEGLFPSGTANVSANYSAILDKVANALQSVKGDLFVVGHTDNIPIFTPRFPSNWHLSVARSKAVVAQLKSSNALSRAITAEGRGDTEPLYENNSKQNRALNRRVEILILQ